MPDPIQRLNAALAGRYLVERRLGEGGMATVYLAEDLKHGRKVALKVLKPELAAVVGAERFLAEIRTTAALQHPHILPLHDSGDADGLLYYVMPRVEGESLRERLDREHQLPVDEAVRIATNVAEALDYAHRQGVIHRDIKPANILLLDGKPVISDFGIALAVTSGGAGRLTETGLSLGTPHYMSPEQATGDGSVGPATDIWALGCVLYEMFVGEPPYTGSTPQAVLGKIITAEAASVSASRKSVPPNVDAAVRKALEKVPADRFRSAEEFAGALRDRGFAHGVGGSPLPAGAGVAPRWRLVALATGASTLAFALALGLLVTRPLPPLPVERFPMPFLPGEEPLTSIGLGPFELSRDGESLVYVARREDQLLMVRRWSDLAATPIEGTTLATWGAMSPDGQSVAFVQANEVKTVSLAGGPVRTLGPGNRPYWGSDGFVYAAFSADAIRYPASGGDAEVVSAAPEGVIAQRVHDLLPRGRALLGMNPATTNALEIHIVDLASGERELLTLGEQPRYARSGHLLYLSDGSLMAAPFDASRARLTGPAVPIDDGVVYYSISEDGKLFYSKGATVGFTLEPVWVSLTGDVSPVDPGWTFDRGDNNEGWSLSPNGTRVAVRERTEDGYDIFIKQIDQGPRSRLTIDVFEDREPRWLADGRTVLFLSRRAEGVQVLAKASDGSGTARTVMVGQVEGTGGAITMTASATGAELIFQFGSSIANPDIYAARPGQDSVPRPVVAAREYGERKPELSSDGRWFAYVSNETGRDEVYVRRFPGDDSPQWPVSRQGGTAPKWSQDGRALFFLGSDRAMYVAAVQGTDDLEVATPRRLFALPDDIEVAGVDFTYDVSVDGQRLLMARVLDGGEAAEAPGTIMVNGFFEELRRLVPTN